MPSVMQQVGPDSPSQADFKSSPYADSSWEVVGDAPRPEEFFPMQVSQLRTSNVLIDPMFADFGGRPTEELSERWHLPEHLAHAASAVARKGEEDSTTIAITPEQLEEIKQQAFEAGRLQGVEESVGSQTERLIKIEQSVRGVVQDLRTQVDEVLMMVARRASDLGVTIAKKVIDGAVDINPEYIVKLIEEALRLAGGATIRKVRVSRQDMEFIEVIGVGKMLKEFDGSWTFETDESIRAGCIVETSAGEVDYDLDRAWERIRDNVIKVVR